MKLSDIQRIIREELSEADVVDLSKRRRQKEIETIILDNVGTSAVLLLSSYKNIDQVQQAYDQQGDTFLIRLMKYMFDISEKPKSTVRMINHLKKMHPNHPVWEDGEKLLAAFKEGVLTALDDERERNIPRKPRLQVVDPELGVGADDDSDF
jgi:hypothetical protein